MDKEQITTQLQDMPTGGRLVFSSQESTIDVYKAVSLKWPFVLLERKLPDPLRHYGSMDDIANILAQLAINSFEEFIYGSEAK